MDLPLVSILITSYNRAAYIEAAIESALAQIYPNTEIIIVDNCSTDETKSILKQYQNEAKINIHINDMNIGQFPNRNKAASLAKGKYIKYLDSDDLLYPHSIAVMVSAIEDCPKCALGIAFEISHHVEKSFPFEIEPSTALHLHFQKGLLFPAPGSIIYKKSVFEAVGGFQDWGLPSDNFLTLKIASKYPIAALPRDLYWWRRHDEQEFQTMSENPRVQLEYFKINQFILTSNICPLNRKEARYHLLCHKVRLSRWVMRSFFKGKTGMSRMIIREVPLQFTDFLLAFIPVKYIQ
ncbi:MAG: glycosyltransferase family 2 protein [Chitinophagaceae bacterium]|nr:glycosyltransferase family 2 protein [Chitinophagaceae bacterium]